MTIEEAIYALDIVEHMESFSVLYEPGEPMNQTTVGKLKEACRMAVSILRAWTDAPPNAPLTLEELREMDGEPVWNDTTKKWAIVDIYSQFGPRTIIQGGRWHPLDDLYYRHRPEEWTT